MIQRTNKQRFLPFLLTAGIIFLDQLTKCLVVAKIPENTIGASFLNGFLRIIHVRNDAIAFSFGSGFDLPVKIIFFVILPIILMGLMAFVIASRKFESEFKMSHYILLCGILGGGLGNIIDRLFRSLRVVDFIDVKFYGLFGMNRFPTFNIADSAVVCSVILLLIFVLFEKKEKKVDE